MIITSFKGREMNKVHFTTLTLGKLTTLHSVPRLHCNLVACQQSAHATSRFLKYKS